MPATPLIPPIRLGARRSALARAQASQVAAALAADGIHTTFVGITTTGDLDQRQLTEIGGTGVFVSAVRDALRRDEIDVAVHSLKDLPTTRAEDLEIIAIPAREDTRDVLIGRRLDDLSDGTRLGTGAPRRAMQMIDWAAGRDIQLEVVPIRGNVETRIERVREGKVDAVTFTSASTVRNFLQIYGEDQAADLLRGTVVAAIGPVTAEAAQQLGINITVMPQRYTIPDLVDALVDHFASVAETR